MKNYEDLKVWARAHELCLTIYELTNSFPSEEKFGLISQLRRASSSIPTNIAEGCGYQTKKEFARFLRIDAGSTSEVEYQLLLSRDLKFMHENDFDRLTKDTVIIRKMLYKLTQSLS